MSGSGSYFDTQSSWAHSYGPMKVVNFHDTKEWRDENAAEGCISVLTSDGKLGTLTHLEVSDRSHIDKFIDCLDKVLRNHKAHSRMILSGGSGQPECQALYNELIEKLAKHQYVIVATCHDEKSLAPKPRVVTLKKDRVLVREVDNEKKQDTVTEINFANGRKQIYTKEHRAQRHTKS